MAKEEDGGKAFMGCILILIMLPVGILLRGFVLMQLWMWFMTPLGVVSITQAHAYGLATMASLFIPHSSPKSDAEESAGTLAVKMFGSLIATPLIVLGIGVICHYFM